MGINSTASRRVSSTSADTTFLDLDNGDKTLRHVAMVAIFLDLNNPRSCKYGRKKCMYDFPVHGCTREQNGSPYFSSNIWRLCQERLGSLNNDDGDGNENGKKAIGLDKQNINFARASRFFVHFFAVAARLQRESA